jgi:hypothetical protein
MVFVLFFFFFATCGALLLTVTREAWFALAPYSKVQTDNCYKKNLQNVLPRSSERKMNTEFSVSEIILKKTGEHCATPEPTHTPHPLLSLFLLFIKFP